MTTLHDADLSDVAGTPAMSAYPQSLNSSGSAKSGTKCWIAGNIKFAQRAVMSINSILQVDMTVTEQQLVSAGHCESLLQVAQSAIPDLLIIIVPGTTSASGNHRDRRIASSLVK